MARAKRGSSNAKAERTLLASLSDALSKDEIRRVLACALLTLKDTSGTDALVERLGGETGATLRAVLGREGRGGARREPRRASPGAAKVLEEWNQAWSDWQACVEATGDESGKYVSPEDPWDCPSPDTTALVADLEAIATRMRPLIPRIVEGHLDPEFSFADSLRRTDDELGAGLPEWFGEADGWDLGCEATSALLEWHWLSARRSGDDAFAFVDRVCALQHDLSKVALDGTTISAFVLALDRGDHENILAGIRRHAGEDRWRRALESSGSEWFRVHVELCRRASPALYLETCRRNVEKDWRLALPVIEDLLAAGAHGDALGVVHRAVGSLLRQERTAWDPRETLLTWSWSPAVHRKDDPVPALLAAWRRTATALADAETAAALGVQIAACRNWEDGDAFLDAIRAIQGAFPATADRLFCNWREHVAEQSDSHAWDEPGDPAPGWAHALADAARAGSQSGEPFRAALRRWLEYVEASPKAFACNHARLAGLTIDLNHGGRVEKRSRALCRMLTRRVESGPDQGLRAWRRHWLERLGARALLDEVLELWQRNAVRLVPDPATGSTYDRCADWLGVVHDLDAVGYRTTVEAWRVTHRRRRNLWQALRDRRLPVGDPPP